MSPTCAGPATPIEAPPHYHMHRNQQDALMSSPHTLARCAYVVRRTVFRMNHLCFETQRKELHAKGLEKRKHGTQSAPEENTDVHYTGGLHYTGFVVNPPFILYARHVKLKSEHLRNLHNIGGAHYPGPHVEVCARHPASVEDQSLGNLCMEPWESEFGSISTSA